MGDPGEIHLLERPRWRRRDDGLVELWYAPYERWQAMLAWTGHVLEAVEREAPYDELVTLAAEHAPGKDPERRLRSLLFSLHVNGYIGLPGDAPPDVYDARFERVAELGRGAAAILDMCRDRSDGATVVVKRAWDFLQPMEHADASIRREAHVLNAVDHPHIVRFVHAFDRDDRVHLVRSYAEGADVLYRFGYEGAKDADAALAYAASAARIVAHLHERDHVLVDLHPGNFLRIPGDARELMLIDLGHARRLVDGTAVVEGPTGTRAFSAPEVRRDRVATVRSDVYSLGRFVFFVATGTIPRAEWDAAELAGRVGSERLAELVGRLTATDPHERPGSVDEVVALVDGVGPRSS